MSSVQQITNSGTASLDKTGTLTPALPNMGVVAVDANNWFAFPPGEIIILGFADNPPVGVPYDLTLGSVVGAWANVLALIPSNGAQAVVQGKTVIQWSASGLPLTLDSPTTPGNTIFAFVTSGDSFDVVINPQPIVITDDAGNDYVLIGGIYSATDTGATSWLYAAFNAASATVVTIQTSNSTGLGDSGICGAWEVFGLSADPLSAAPSAVQQPLAIPQQSNLGESQVGSLRNGSSTRGIELPGLPIL